MTTTRTWALAAAILLTCVHSPAAQQLAGVGATDPVLLGRVYRRAGGATEPVMRLAVTAGGSQQVHAIPEAAFPEGGALTLGLSVKGSSDRGRVAWTLTPGAGARVPAASGKLEVKRGTLVHADLATADGATLFATFEYGRAADFDFTRLSHHFGAPIHVEMPPGPNAPYAGWPASFPGSAAAPPAGAIVAAPAPPPPATQFTVVCGNGSSFAIGTGTGTGDCEVDVRDGVVTGGRCDDGRGNAAVVDCAIPPAGQCVRTTGAGSCRMR